MDYTYDVLYRLTQENITDPSLGNRSITYTYDPVGNRLSKVDTVEGSINYIYANGDPINNIDSTGKFSLIQTLTVVTITSILTNIVISLWAFDTAAKCNFKFDGILLSARFDISHIVAGGSGIDLLLECFSLC